ncbi:MAG: peptidase M50 [Actinomycetota bacterium]|nr:peptidase M50 [Actinomycetota bacterium]
MSTAARARTRLGWRIGRLAGVPVYIGRSWVLIAAVITLVFGPVVRQVVPELGTGSYAVAALFALLLLVSVLVHEAAHALVGQACGYRVSRVVADFWGGHTAYDSSDSTPGRSALVAVAGPLANAALAGVGWLVSDSLPDGVPALLAAAFTYANAFVAAFNLLPGLPLDGGFLVDALVWRLTGSRGLGTLVAGWSGRLLTLSLVWWALGMPLLRGEQLPLTRLLWVALIGSFLWIGAGDAVRTGRARRVFERTTVGSVCRAVATVDGDTMVDRLPPARHGLAQVVVDQSGAPVGVVDREAIARVPVHLLATTPVRAVVRHQPEGWAVTAGLDDPVTAVVIAMQTLRTTVVAVQDASGQVVGLVHAADV